MLAVVLAVLITAEPLLHHHSIQQNTIPGACAICATGVTPLPLPIAAICAPQIVAYTLTIPAVTIVTAGVSLSLASRAPPVL